MMVITMAQVVLDVFAKDLRQWLDSLLFSQFLQVYEFLNSTNPVNTAHFVHIEGANRGIFT